MPNFVIVNLLSKLEVLLQYSLNTVTMGIKQNLKLWENNVTYLDENGVTASRKILRVMPPAPWKLARLLSTRSWILYLVGLYVIVSL